MQHPVGARFNLDTMRMEVTDFAAVVLNPVAQSKFVHTVSAGYVTGAVFVMAISAFYLLKGRHRDLAVRSMTVAASFGLAAALSVVVLGDESGYTVGENQKMKIAAIEAMWRTEPAPASFTVFGLPDRSTHTTRDEIRLPWLLGLIATRSLDGTVEGIDDLVAHAEQRIRSGMIAYGALRDLHAHPGDPALRAAFDAHADDLGHALLLKRTIADPAQATDADIKSAALDTVPPVAPLFWSFRIMVGLGFGFIALFATAFVLACRRRLDRSRLFLWACLLALPAPWIAAELGWYVAEGGRQPWTIDGVLPTFLSVSSVPAGNVLLSLISFVLFYSVLAAVDGFLMVRTVRLGPPPASAADADDSRDEAASPFPAVLAE
jgi:cytochrome d ubiquinol oxidase subunit I